VVGQAKPASQLVQAVDPEGEYVPAVQATGLLDAEEHENPAGQRWHWENPESE
jgi:hypothetical protein